MAQTVNFTDASAASSPLGPYLLAKLTDLKTQLNTASTAQDALLTSCLAAATQRAMGQDGLGRNVQRATGIIEFPVLRPPEVVAIRLKIYPLETITSVQQAYEPTTETDFAAVAALMQDQDFTVDADSGVLTRLNDLWFASQPRCLRIVYAGGWIDPGNTTIPGTAILPPADLQQGVISDAIALWRRGSVAGLTGVTASSGASAQFGPLALHPDLVAACQRLRFTEL